MKMRCINDIVTWTEYCKYIQQAMQISAMWHHSIDLNFIYLLLQLCKNSMDEVDGALNSFHFKKSNLFFSKLSLTLIEFATMLLFIMDYHLLKKTERFEEKIEKKKFVNLCLNLTYLKDIVYY
ncbi:hypothetical protein RFI_19067 [Reticulomyxa filosa]|uniref:Uncharacterized protein n=1 Tax=Reticulomyxa filosa TaxID=46433 RepID=X6MW36_RETFI|nr:hypothetical protein RFI_19067 [Reticulomyxa filosa]|eukprot:ETO18213.1 hypothetical protein RFI_19067 [Reticulomyxa filosa]